MHLLLNIRTDIEYEEMVKLVFALAHAAPYNHTLQIDQKKYSAKKQASAHKWAHYLLMHDSDVIAPHYGRYAPQSRISSPTRDINIRKRGILGNCHVPGLLRVC